MPASDKGHLSESPFKMLFALSFDVLFFYLYWRSAAAISVKESNGTFISTLNLLLYNVSSHQSSLNICYFAALETNVHYIYTNDIVSMHQRAYEALQICGISAISENDDTCRRWGGYQPLLCSPSRQQTTFNPIIGEDYTQFTFN